MVGLPGSGKSTWLGQIGVSAISSDSIRDLLIDDPTCQTIHGRVFSTVRFLLRNRLDLRRPVTYIDATNLTPEERRPYLEIGRAWQCEVEAVFLDIPLDLCLQRNAARARKVPEEAMRKMAAKLTPPSQDEGFTRISVVSDETGIAADLYR